MSAAIARRPNGKEAVKPPPTPPDYQEIAALDEAEAALINFMPGVPQPRNLATIAISAWIVSRTRQSARIRMAETLVFDLTPARYRGYAEAALGVIAQSLANLPSDVPFFELSKSQVVDVIVASMCGIREAAVAAGESAAFPFDDEIPYG